MNIRIEGRGVYRSAKVISAPMMRVQTTTLLLLLDATNMQGPPNYRYFLAFKCIKHNNSEGVGCRLLVAAVVEIKTTNTLRHVAFKFVFLGTL